jgi:GNAT superfamily N-acetyltransferase
MFGKENDVFREIRKQEEIIAYNELWGDFCEENELPFLERNGDLTRYGIYSEEERLIGTVECSRYDFKDHDKSNYFYPYHENKFIKHIQNEKIYEISKLLISRDSRGKGNFKQIMLALYEHAIKNDADWYIGTINKRLYMFVRSVGFKILPLDDYFAINDNISAIPILFDAKFGIYLMENAMEYKELVNNIK